MADKQRRKTGPGVLDMNTEQLFEKYTIVEIRKVERKTRAEIEKKKEDLRQMVGERYRDLIDAADTISEMKTCTEKIVTAVQGMQGYCSKLQKTHMTKGVLATPRGHKTERSPKDDFYAIASQTKLLMDMPEKIWSAVESGEHLKAAELYLLACHIVSSLQLDGNTQQSAKLLAWFPVLSRQWDAISHFKAGILQSCRILLKNGSVSDQATAEALCCIMLLEETSPRQVFTEFLLARKAAMQHCFHTSQHGLGVKGQICSVIELLCVTVKQIYAVFYHQQDKSYDDEEHCNLLLRTLQDVTSAQHSSNKKGILQSEVASASFTKHLPISVVDFRPSPRTPSTSIAASYLHQSVEQWIETCIQDVHNGVSKLLNHVTSMKALAAIRDAVWDLLYEDNAEVIWSVVCQCVVNRHLSLWGEFIRPLFLTRVQAIIQDALDKTSTTTQKHTQQALGGLDSMSADSDVAAYIWAEAPSDVPSPAAWKGRGAFSKEVVEPGGLYMKARAFTPRTQRICSTLDSLLKSLLDDMTQYTAVQDQQQTPAGDKAAKMDDEPFDKFADSVTLHSFLQISCTACLQRMLSYFEKQLEETRSQLDSSIHLGQMEHSSHVVDRALLLGRLCLAIVELCPNLQKAANISEPETRQSKPEPQSWLRSKLMGKRTSKATDAHKETEWDKLKGLLLQKSQDAYRIWSEFTSSSVLADFREFLMDSSTEAALKAATHWDIIEIQEESEEGKKVTSKIRLPVQASWFVQTVLYSLCEEINRVGGHALSRAILTGLVHETSTSIWALYKQFLDESSTRASGLTLVQTQSIQLLFDVRFIAIVMSGWGDDTKKNARHTEDVQKLVDRLESTIDPFDLDVFLPHLQTNLSRHTHRCTMLLGALASPEKHLYSSHRAAPSGYQEQHNILPLSNTQGRFTLLPLSTSSSHSLPRSLPRPLPQSTVPSAVHQDQPSTPPSLHKSHTAPYSLYSKFGSLKTGWLANIGGAH